jgi:hypothetical protein
MRFPHISVAGHVLNGTIVLDNGVGMAVVGVAVGDL